MNKDYKKELEKEYEKLRNEFLIQNGYIEKVTSKDKKDDFIYDYTKNEYYKFVPIKLRNEDLEYIVSLKKKCNNIKSYSSIVYLFKIVAILNFIICIIFDISIALYYSSIYIFIILVYFTLIISLFFLGMAKIFDILSEK